VAGGVGEVLLEVLRQQPDTRSAAASPWVPARSGAHAWPHLEGALVRHDSLRAVTWPASTALDPCSGKDSRSELLPGGKAEAGRRTGREQA